MSSAIGFKKYKAILFLNMSPKALFTLLDQLRKLMLKEVLPLIGVLWQVPNMPVSTEAAFNMAQSPFSRGLSPTKEANGTLACRCAVARGVKTIAMIRGRAVPLYRLNQLLILTKGPVPDNVTNNDGRLIIPQSVRDVINISKFTKDDTDQLWIECDESGYDICDR